MRRTSLAAVSITTMIAALSLVLTACPNDARSAGSSSAMAVRSSTTFDVFRPRFHPIEPEGCVADGKMIERLDPQSLDDPNIDAVYLATLTTLYGTYSYQRDWSEPEPTVPERSDDAPIMSEPGGVPYQSTWYSADVVETLWAAESAPARTRLSLTDLSCNRGDRGSTPWVMGDGGSAGRGLVRRQLEP